MILGPIVFQLHLIALSISFRLLYTPYISRCWNSCPNSKWLDFVITINSHILKWKFSRGLTRKNCENKTTAKITTYTVFVPITWVLFYLIVWLLEAPARHPPSHQWQKLSDNAPSPQLLWDCTSTISPPPPLGVVSEKYLHFKVHMAQFFHYPR